MKKNMPPDLPPDLIPDLTHLTPDLTPDFDTPEGLPDNFLQEEPPEFREKIKDDFILEILREYKKAIQGLEKSQESLFHDSCEYFAVQGDNAEFLFDYLYNDFGTAEEMLERLNYQLSDVRPHPGDPSSPVLT